MTVAEIMNFWWQAVLRTKGAHLVATFDTDTNGGRSACSAE